MRIVVLPYRYIGKRDVEVLFEVFCIRLDLLSLHVREVIEQDPDFVLSAVAAPDHRADADKHRADQNKHT